MAKHWSAALVRMYACVEAVEWARTQPSLRAAWDNCECADWMLWLLERTESNDDPRFRAFMIENARAVAHLVSAPETRHLNAIDCAERYLCGEATDAELTAAWDAALNAARDAAGAAWAAAWYAAWYAAGDAAGDAAWDARKAADSGQIAPSAAVKLAALPREEEEVANAWDEARSASR